MPLTQGCDAGSGSFDDSALQALHNMSMALLLDTQLRVDSLVYITAALRIFLRML